MPFGDLQACPVVFQHVKGRWPIARRSGVVLRGQQRRIPTDCGKDIGLIASVKGPSAWLQRALKSAHLMSGERRQFENLRLDNLRVGTL